MRGMCGSAVAEAMAGQATERAAGNAGASTSEVLAHGGAEFAAEGAGDDDLFAAGGGDGLGGFVGELLGFEGDGEMRAGRNFGGGETLGADLA